MRWPRLSLTFLKRSRSRNSTAGTLRLALRFEQGLREPFAEQHLVRQAGERIVERVLAQLFRDLPVSRDVALGADQVAGLPEDVRSQLDPSVVAVLVTDAIRAVEPGRGARPAVLE